MNYLLWNAAGPATWPLWLVLAALFFAAWRWRTASHLALLAAGAAILLLAILPTGALLVGKLEQRHAPPPLADKTITRIAVLTGAEHLARSEHTGILQTNRHAERLLETLRLSRRFPAAKILIVGGVRYRRAPRRDVDWVFGFLRDAGVPPNRLQRVGGAFDTCSNAKTLAKAAQKEPVLLVTSAFHMPRAMACMNRAGVNAMPWPVDFQTGPNITFFSAFSSDWIENLMLSDLAMHEHIGLAYYRASGRIN